jgi:hypothetical protein
MLVICGIAAFVVRIAEDPLGSIYLSNNYPNSSRFPNQGSFLIDPETILESRNNGKRDVFTPYLDQVDGELPKDVFNGPISWTSDEHFMIAGALNHLVWNDDLNDWKLYEMDFLLDCQDNLNGFERSYMMYFKGFLTYDVRAFSIIPRYRYVEWREDSDHSHPLLGWKSIDLKRLRINALDALEIAEENGGKGFRLKSNNHCRIRVFMQPENFSGWVVRYSNANSIDFQLTIDPFTGAVIE